MTATLTQPTHATPPGSLPRLLKELGDQGRPPRLVARPEPFAGVAVEVLVEQHQVTPVRVLLKYSVASVRRTTLSVLRQEESREPPRQFLGDLCKRQVLPRPGRAFHGELVAVVVVVALQPLDQQQIRRKPHGPAPVRVASEQT